MNKKIIIKIGFTFLSAGLIVCLIGLIIGNFNIASIYKNFVDIMESQVGGADPKYLSEYKWYVKTYTFGAYAYIFLSLLSALAIAYIWLKDKLKPNTP